MNNLAPISNLTPHYTNEYYREPRTVWKSEFAIIKREGRYESVPHADYEYSDRLYQWDYKRAEYAHKVAKRCYSETRCAAYIEVYLRVYFKDHAVKLVHIMAGFNWSNGFPYQVYGFIREQDSK